MRSCFTRLTLPHWLLIAGLAPLGVAWVAQYGLGLPPCHFCLLQRWPYGLVALAGLLAMRLPLGGLPWRLLVALAFYGLLATALLGLIHTGIETKFLAYQGGCVASADISLAAIMAAPLVACDAVLASFLGLSMAGWNVLYAITALALLGWRYSCEVTVCR